jgi:hypothetical protein
LTEPACSFCDKPADTKEHVIPKWLQQHFNLWDQRLGLWNETQLSYRQAQIPACRHCNNVRFSKLEEAVQAGSANDQELYLWALKIRYGLSLMDSRLLLDRRSPDLGPLLPQDKVTYGAAFVRHAFLALDRKPFRFDPFPFGSVFMFRGPPAKPERFDLVDVPPPYWSLAVSLPGNKTLAVLFADRGVTKRIMRRYAPLRRDIEELGHHLPEASAKTIMFALLRWQVGLVIPSGLRLSEDGVISERVPRKIRVRDPQLIWFRQIAANCGLPDALGHQAFDRDKDRLRVPYLRYV